ncbi:hypothetical protein E1263_34785 [Kribbella antibiotica]|uniref:Uncharacterized protein n=1 Tax=Kribbella antibiotica TaxID=190195 RepID=A0A4R4YQB0_9ACTN|nr:hypothetical protein [Kribbella antibiotica]TDD47331.1 hypothetical protein E1263_34785 [Kribbella antibiotica]
METDDRLPELMRRATETLEPRYPDLVERGIRRGVVRRRRRRVLSVVASAAAVALTVGGVAVVQAQIGPRASLPPIAGPSTPAAKTSPTKPVPLPPASPAQTLRTLKKLLPGLQTSGAKTWGDDFIAAGLFIDDGHGKAWLEMGIQTVKYDPNCTDQPPSQNCKVRPDGTFLRSYRGAEGRLVYNAVVLEYPDRRAINLTSTSGTGTKGSPSRPEPPLSIDQLVELADNQGWSFPAANYGKNLNR